MSLCCDRIAEARRLRARREIVCDNVRACARERELCAGRPTALRSVEIAQCHSARVIQLETVIESTIIIQTEGCCFCQPLWAREAPAPPQPPPRDPAPPFASAPPEAPLWRRRRRKPSSVGLCGTMASLIGMFDLESR